MQTRRKWVGDFNANLCQSEESSSGPDQFLAGVAIVSLALATISVGGRGTTALPSGGPGSQWPVYHGGFAGSGVAAGSSVFHRASSVWTSHRLRGQIGEPLVANNEVVAATKTDSVYAPKSWNGDIRWSRPLRAAVPAGRLSCGDIRPKVCSSDTRVINSARSKVFVVADGWAHHAVAHHLVVLDLATGNVLLNEVVDPPGSTPVAQLQRSALILDNGDVIVASGGNAGDCGTYPEWVVAAPEAGGPIEPFEVDPTPGNDQGAVWMGGAAPTSTVREHLVRNENVVP